MDFHYPKEKLGLDSSSLNNDYSSWFYSSLHERAWGQFFSFNVPMYVIVIESDLGSNWTIVHSVGVKINGALFAKAHHVP